MNFHWWYVVLFYVGIFIGGYIWGAAQQLGKNDWKKK